MYDIRYITSSFGNNSRTVSTRTRNKNGVDENGVQIICLYPNPANDVIRIDGIGENAEVRIYNTTGALVKVVNVSDGEEINVSELNAGFYIVRSGKTVSKKLIGDGSQ